MSLKEQIQSDKIPQHIAFIMDGNGRWASQRGRNRIAGHKQGVKPIRMLTEVCGRLGVKYVTLYAFSTENWNRPQVEVTALMELLLLSIQREIPTLNKNKIRLQVIGDISSLPKRCLKAIQTAMEETITNDAMHLVLALNYSGRSEITRMTQQVSQDVLAGKIQVSAINQTLLEDYLYTRGIPDPELIIRTSGEYRISNFLLWQLAYAELYFCEKMWPDFDEEDLYASIVNYQKRERRFGKTSEQIQPK